MHSYSLFSVIKERQLYSQKNFRGTPENCEKRETLAQRIFPSLRYCGNLKSAKVIFKFNRLRTAHSKKQETILVLETYQPPMHSIT